MSLRTALPRLRTQIAGSSRLAATPSTSLPLRQITTAPRAPPKHLRTKVKRALAREEEYKARVAHAKAHGLPIPRFKPFVVPQGLKWYKVERTSGGELPVYTDVRADGGYKTILKRIEGDIHSCQREINAWFENNHFDPIAEAPKGIMKAIPRQLVFKGNMRKEIQEWLVQKGY